MAETTEREPRALAEKTDHTLDVESVNLLVRRTGCTVRDAEITLAGHELGEQRRIASTGKPDVRLIEQHDLAEAIAVLDRAGIRHDEPCPFGAPRTGPCPTWGDVVARMVMAGEAVSIGGLIKRAKPGTAA